MTSLRVSLDRLTKENEKLLAEDDFLRADYDDVRSYYSTLHRKRL